jgi:2-polyprenyl-6-methoxyphenol hydroxylase-like FAD-dependent oxidoreductase
MNGLRQEIIGGIVSETPGPRLSQGRMGPFHGDVLENASLCSAHTGAELEGFENINDTVCADIAGHGQITTDLLMCADGPQSETRRRLLPQVPPHYAGYIAWRGTVDEALLVAFFDATFTFSEARSGGQILVYFIPGAKPIGPKVIVS